MYEVAYRRPGTLAEAATMFSATGEARYLAGGQTLIPVMKLRLAAPGAVIDLGRLGELRGITAAGGAVTIGAGVTHAEVADSAEVKRAIPALAVLAGEIGDPAVRHRGTIGGSLANNDPGADYPAGVLGLNATVHTDRRQIAADAFFTGLFSTVLQPGEIITKVSFPVPKAAAYQKFPSPASRFAMAGVMVARLADGSVRVAVTGASQSGVFRLAAAEQALARSFTPASLDGVAVDANGMTSDVHGSAQYRAHLVKVMAKRAVAAAA